MSTPAIAALTVLGTLWTTGLVGVCLLVRRGRRRESERVYLEAHPCMWDAGGRGWATVHEVGPDGLRLLTDLEAHLKAYGATVADLYVAPADTDHTTKGD